MKKVTVNVVTTPPAIGKVAMIQGIRTREEAEHWAEKNGFSTVYWLKSRQRVYAEKYQKAESVPMLFAPSERGGGCLEFILLIAIIGLAVYWFKTHQL